MSQLAGEANVPLAPNTQMVEMNFDVPKELVAANYSQVNTRGREEIAQKLTTGATRDALNSFFIKADARNEEVGVFMFVESDDLPTDGEKILKGLGGEDIGMLSWTNDGSDQPDHVFLITQAAFKVATQSGRGELQKIAG